MKKILTTALFAAVSGLAFSQAFTMVNTFAGTGTPGLVNGSLSTAEFNGLYSLCCDFSTGDLYVSDAMNSTVRKISGGNVTTLAGSGSIGDVDAQGTSAQFYYTSGLCFANGYVYVSDNGNKKKKKIDASGNVTTVAGSTIGYLDGPVASAQFNNPTDVKVASNGDIYVADYGNNCIRKISGGMVTTYAGVAGGGGDQIGPASSALFNRPSAICFNLSGTDLYVADQVNNKVKVISSGMVSLLAGSGTPGNVNGTGAAAQFNHPSYIVLDLYGNPMVSEWINNDIRRITPAGVVTSLAGSGTAGYVNGPVSTAEFNSPYGICVDNLGTIYVGDKLNNVVRNLFKGDVGISENFADQALSISPNPSSSLLTIKNNSSLKNISIYDLSGKLCRSVEVNDQQQEIIISVADLSSGEYLIVGLNDKQRFSSKFIKE
ncbi:MAG: T9SS type A sorting domain-containing protein [Bacteroidetes bacterium]|nr:T9SS type A sorting domain-containing protein [Bacteroidota bacterium]